MKKVVLAAAAVCLVVGSAAQQSKGYVLRGTAAFEGAEGAKVYLSDYHTNKRTDSCTVKDGTFFFCGQTDAPAIRRIEIGRLSSANAIIEAGELWVEMTPARQGQASVHGSPLNEQLADYKKQQEALLTDLRAQRKAFLADSTLSEARKEAFSDSLWGAVSAQLFALGEAAIESNAHNMLAAFILWDLSNEYTPERFEQQLTKLSPEVQAYAPLQRKLAQNKKLAETSAGKPFKDFAAKKTDGTTDAKLSDYVGKGQWVLTDFWASWCGPCRAEIPHIKAVYEQFKDKGVVVLGINVWDKLDKCNEAIKQLEMPWESIFVADQTATDLYGINGIPHLILFAPDGTIAARGLRGEEIAKEIEKQLAAAPKPAKKAKGKR